MEIDLFTVSAQIVNFIILLLLLKYLLYGRIVKTMDKREAMIASRIRDAEEENAKAEEKHRSLAMKEEELNRERGQKLLQAAEEAGSRKKEMIEAARRDADDSKTRWLESLGRQKDSFLRDLRVRSGQEVFAVARKVLDDLADADLENRIVITFVAQLDQLQDKTKEEIVKLARGPGKEVTVRSSFEMSGKMKETVQSALRQHMRKDLEVAFETSPELICGVELRVGDRRVSWNFDNYLSMLEDRASAAFEEAETGEGRKNPQSVSE